MKNLAISLARGALDALPLNLAVLDANGDILAANEAWKQFGRENGVADPAATDQNYLVAASRANDADARAATAGIRAVLAGDRETFDYEYPCHSPDEQRWFLMSASRFSADGEPYAVVAHQDITDRKLAELAVERKNENLEALASLLSHDLRNPLNVAMGRADLLAAETDSDHADAVTDALDRMNALLDQSLTVLRGTGDLAREDVPLHDVATDAWTYVGTPDATLDLRENATLRGDPEFLQTIFENLFKNAVEHGSTSDRAGNRHDDAVEHSSTSNRDSPNLDDAAEQDGAGVRVAVGAFEDGVYVADDGPGIPPADRDDVFELGVTNSEDGTGFGLGIVKRLVENHGWTISVAESDRGGARFEIRTRPGDP